jgi:hypothetical protein
LTIEEALNNNTSRTSPTFTRRRNHKINLTIPTRRANTNTSRQTNSNSSQNDNYTPSDPVDLHSRSKGLQGEGSRAGRKSRWRQKISSFSYKKEKKTVSK